MIVLLFGEQKIKLLKKGNRFSMALSLTFLTNQIFEINRTKIRNKISCTEFKISKVIFLLTNIYV